MPCFIGPGSRVTGPVSPDPGPGYRVIGPGSWVPGPGKRICSYFSFNYLENNYYLFLGSSNIYASWAGGSLGRQLTDKLIHSLQKILSEHGIAYIVLEQCNKPQEVKESCERLHFQAEFVLSRRAGREYLHVLRLKKQ